MSAIYDRLEAQQTALQSIPVYGADVRLDKPPSGEDPTPLIYLEPALDFDGVDDRATTTVTWTAIVVADPQSILLDALDAQDSLVSALLDDACHARSVSREQIGDRNAWAQSLPVSVTITFTTSISV